MSRMDSFEEGVDIAAEITFVEQPKRKEAVRSLKCTLSFGRQKYFRKSIEYN